MANKEFPQNAKDPNAADARQTVLDFLGQIFTPAADAAAADVAASTEDVAKLEKLATLLLLTALCCTLIKRLLLFL